MNAIFFRAESNFGSNEKYISQSSRKVLTSLLLLVNLSGNGILILPLLAFSAISMSDGDGGGGGDGGGVGVCGRSGSGLVGEGFFETAGFAVASELVLVKAVGNVTSVTEDPFPLLSGKSLESLNADSDSDSDPLGALKRPR